MTNGLPFEHKPIKIFRLTKNQMTNRVKQWMTLTLVSPLTTLTYNKFRMIIKSEIDQLFLHAWLKVHKFEVDQLDLRSIKSRNHIVYEITNSLVNTLLLNDYSDFQKSEKSVEDYFNVDILICKKNGRDTFGIKNTKPLTRRIIILFKTKNNKFDFESHPIVSKTPIEMSVESILSIYGIFEKVEILPFMEFNASDLEDRHQVCLDLYRKVGDVCQLHYDLPGFRHPTWTPKHRIKIAVDHTEIPYLPKFYWIPCDNLISTEYFCTKMPRKCGYSTFHLGNLEKHEKVCSDQTIIKPKQVVLIKLLNF